MTTPSHDTIQLAALRLGVNEMIDGYLSLGPGKAVVAESVAYSLEELLQKVKPKDGVEPLSKCRVCGEPVWVEVREFSTVEYCLTCATRTTSAT